MLRCLALLLVGEVFVDIIDSELVETSFLLLLPDDRLVFLMALTSFSRRELEMAGCLALVAVTVADEGDVDDGDVPDAF
jgi:hypothetical protein